MGNKPLILADNLMDTVVLHPQSLIANSGADDVAGNEVWRIADNLRDASFWTTVGTNSGRSITLQNGSPATAVQPNVLILDRGHNLAGATVTLAASSDNFASSNVTQLTATIPAVAGGLPIFTNGCVTTEGAWWIEFVPTQAYAYWRLTVPALGAGVAPIVTGVYLGTTYRFPEYFDAPAAIDYRRKLQYQRNVQARGGLRVKSRPLVYGEAQIHLQCEAADYPGLDAQVQAMLYLNAPWWLCLDDSDDTQSGLMRLFQFAGDTTYDPTANPVHRMIELDLEEVGPRTYL